MISLVEFFLLASAGTLTAAGASHGYNLLRQPRDRGDRTSSPRPQEPGLDQPSTGAWHTPRQAPRHRMSARIECFQDNTCSLGTLIDISKQGWRAHSERRIARGATISVNVFLPGQPVPISIDEAVVRWTSRMEFGLELTRMKPEAAARLGDYLTNTFPVDREESTLALSPFSYN